MLRVTWLVKPEIKTRCHCEERQRRSNPEFKIQKLAFWIATHLADAHNDEVGGSDTSQCHNYNLCRHSRESGNPVMLVVNILAGVFQWARQSINKSRYNFKHLYISKASLDSDFRRNDGEEKSWHYYLRIVILNEVMNLRYFACAQYDTLMQNEVKNTQSQQAQ